MNAEQTYRLIRLIIVALLICVTSITIICLVLHKNPSSINTTVSFKEVQLEIACEFYDGRGE